LRDRRLEFRKFVRQKILGRYRLDFYCHDEKLVVELDGLYHDSSEQQLADQLRTEWLEAQGLKVIRFRNEDIMKNLESALEVIKLSFTPFPHESPPTQTKNTNPIPSPVGEGGAKRRMRRG
jgi:5-methyltetrahydrofolate--homocysteine methyltransferase